MKLKIQLAAAAAIFGAGALVCNAQTTNVVEELGIQLTALTQGADVTNGNNIFRSVDSSYYGTHQVIKDLGTATTNSFSREARLLRVTPLIDGTNGATATLIQDGTNTVDVSGFFTFTTDGGPVVDSIHHKKGPSSGVRFSVHSLSLKDQTGFPALTTHFEVQGFDTATFHRWEATTNHPASGSFNAYWSANGTGDHAGKAAIFDGSVTVNFSTITTNSL